jgi:hypothetical protein
MHLRLLAPTALLAVTALLISACGTSQPAATTAPSVAPSAAPSAAAPSAVPSGSATGSLELRQAPADLGCDTIGVEYRNVTFQIDPGAEEPVTAQTDTGKSLQTFWSAGFEGSAAERVVKDPTGQVVATNGETLVIPEGAFPRLHGYFVCPSPNALYILIQDPA